MKVIKAPGLAVTVVILTLLLPAAAARGAPVATIEQGFLTSFDGVPIAYSLFLPESASLNTGTTLFGTPRAYAAGTAKVIDDDQVTAQRVTSLSDLPQDMTIDLSGVAWQVADGHTLALEVSSTPNDHASSRAPSISYVAVEVSLPTCTRPARWLAAC